MTILLPALAVAFAAFCVWLLHKSARGKTEPAISVGRFSTDPGARATSAKAPVISADFRRCSLLRMAVGSPKRYAAAGPASCVLASILTKIDASVTRLVHRRVPHRHLISTGDLSRE